MADDEFDGNRSMTRVIAEQMFDVWNARQSSLRSRFTASIPAWIACALSLVVLIWGAGMLAGQVNRNTNDIRDLKAAQAQQAAEDQVTRDRLARIEAKVDVLIEGARR